MARWTDQGQEARGRALAPGADGLKACAAGVTEQGLPGVQRKDRDSHATADSSIMPSPSRCSHKMMAAFSFLLVVPRAWRVALALAVAAARASVDKGLGDLRGWMSKAVRVVGELQYVNAMLSLMPRTSRAFWAPPPVPSERPIAEAPPPSRRRWRRRTRAP